MRRRKWKKLLRKTRKFRSKKPATWANRIRQWNAGFKSRTTVRIAIELRCNGVLEIVEGEDYRTVLPQTCRYCGVALTPDNASLDHIHPLVRGGLDVAENLHLVCKTDNLAKGSLLDTTYTQLVDAVKDLNDLDMIKRKLRCAWRVR